MNTTTKATHTPGPWKLLLAPTQIVTDREVIATLEAAKEQFYNAHLIAAAPELLEAIQLLLSEREAAERLLASYMPNYSGTVTGDSDAPTSYAMDFSRKVISKAKGEA